MLDQACRVMQGGNARHYPLSCADRLWPSGRRVANGARLLSAPAAAGGDTADSSEKPSRELTHCKVEVRAGGEAAEADDPGPERVLLRQQQRGVGIRLEGEDQLIACRIETEGDAVVDDRDEPGEAPEGGAQGAAGQHCIAQGVQVGRPETSAILRPKQGSSLSATALTQAAVRRSTG